jgi:hypothetical protein
MSGKQHKHFRNKRLASPQGAFPMKAISTVWLYVCLCTSLSVVPLMAAAGGAAAGADVPTNVRTADETNKKLNASVVARNDIQTLEHARAPNDDVYASLQSFVCNEEINRFKRQFERPDGACAGHCDGEAFV